MWLWVLFLSFSLFSLCVCVVCPPRLGNVLVPLVVLDLVLDLLLDVGISLIDVIDRRLASHPLRDHRRDRLLELRDARGRLRDRRGGLLEESGGRGVAGGVGSDAVGGEGQLAVVALEGVDGLVGTLGQLALEGGKVDGGGGLFVLCGEGLDLGQSAAELGQLGLSGVGGDVVGDRGPVVWGLLLCVEGGVVAWLAK